MTISSLWTPRVLSAACGDTWPQSYPSASKAAARPSSASALGAAAPPEAAAGEEEEEEEEEEESCKGAGGTLCLFSLPAGS